MSKDSKAEPAQEESSVIDFSVFLVNTAPNKPTAVSNIIERNTRSAGKYKIKKLHIILPCSHPECGGERNYVLHNNTFSDFIENTDEESGYLTFVCRNCGVSRKKYSLLIQTDGITNIIDTKYGEIPEFGIYIEPEIEKFLGEHLETFNKAVACETKGYGIAAFAYYRRVIEDIKGTLFDKIIQVCEKIDGEPDLISELKQAKEEKKFTSSVDKIRHGMPDSLRVDGHNPLTLLHDALSEGLHNDSDDECLDIAHAIRAILGGLLKNMDYALKDNQKLKDSVTSLLKRKKARVDSKKQQG